MRLRVPWLRLATLALGALLTWLAVPAGVSACSPPFEPSIRKLGPAQVVVVGAIGERVASGRVFHVERWYNGGVPAAAIVIAFKEGEPIGDCSYLVSAGQRLIIAPYVNELGGLAADLGTLQADPASDVGRAYLAEADDLFGSGVVFPQADPQTGPPVPEPASAASPSSDLVGIALGVVLLAALVFVTVVVVARRGRAR